MHTVDSHPHGHEHELLPVCSPRSPAELAVVLSLLDSEGIYHHVSHDHFGSLHVGPVMPLYNEKIVLVRETDFEVASALITPLDADDLELDARGFTFFEKIRMMIEVLIFGWKIPMHGSVNERSDA